MAKVEAAEWWNERYEDEKREDKGEVKTRKLYSFLKCVSASIMVDIGIYTSTTLYYTNIIYVCILNT